MDDLLGFTVDDIKFSELGQYVEELHERGMRYVPLIHPGISGSEVPGTYPPLDLGLSPDIFIQDPGTGKPFMSHVWYLNVSYYVDFSHPAVPSYWTTLLDYLYNQVPFDGLWLVSTSWTHP